MAKKFVGGMATTSGMTPLMFYILGVFPLYMCFEGIKSFSVVGSRSKFLSFPRVTPIDVAVATSLSSFSVYFLLFWLIAIPVSIYEQAWPPENIMKVMLSLIAGLVLGLGFGFTLSAAFRVFPPMKQFVGYIVFGLRMASGMFFCIASIPLAYWPYLTWNPLLHITEMSRDAWFESYVSPIASPLFVAECMLGLLLLGLSMERFMRRVPYI
jgi:capsular polysaccharide transport system permease protein